MDGQTSSMTKNTGEEWRRTGDDEDNSRGRRNRGGKIRDIRVNGRRR